MAPIQILKLQNTFKPGGKVFEVERAAAEHSGLVQMLLQDFDDSDLEAIIPISVDVSDKGLAKVFEWMTHSKDLPKTTDDGSVRGPDDSAVNWKPLTFSDWDKKFFDALDSEALYEILIAANYLDIKPLYELGCQFVANMIRGKTTEQIREILNITSDFNPEEELRIREQKALVKDESETAEKN
ncbi:07a284ee-cb0f-46ca-9b81-433da5893860 [Thermothielavioides terrestris]|uniref:E3 ubiquitin ligase complex SCF subunit n=2 Tax=Thermothielavioides terrestris TaxID=2587410 RepID=G2R602_THETT|nr:uncharacterized protein THITE_2130140 [Thermothielavioides terrestris NRRL 8126]AEO68389.1 hypothetical protein THITE_2130140 [Thermothielavioides terrestris NRRL 8126]SPQ24338.1 07a284ee-cb0f-46ca-9b81-433da5893860 [Thermothielavioides terrestris]